jgi:hypothetical protein
VANLIASLGTSAGSRVYMLKLPQKPTLPAVRVQGLGGPRGQHLRGPDGIYKTRVQVDNYVAETGDAYAAVRGLADDVKGDGLGANASGVWGYVGTFGSPSIAVQNVELLHDGLPEYEAGELRLLRIRQDYMVHWKD